MPYRNLILYFLVLVLLSTVAFKKKEEDKPQLIDTVLYPNFSHLDKGNYWIYEQYNIDEFGKATPTGVIDSCFIGNDTTIAGVKWHWYISIGGESTLLRDSLDYIVDSYGMIRF